MTGNTFLQIALFVQIFVMGALTAIAVRHAYVHFKPKHHEPEKNLQMPTVDLPKDVKERLVEASQTQFKSVINQSSEKLQADLGVTTGHINNLVLRLASEIVSGELERYRQDLGKLHEHAPAEMSGISSEIANHEKEIKAKMTQEIEQEKQRLIKQIDTKLADAIGSFLVETLGHNVDLGSQSNYLTQMLEEHKEEITKGVVDGTQASK